MQIVALRFLSYRYKNERSVVFKIRQNPFSAGVRPGPRWGSSRRSPDPIVGCRRDTPPHTSLHLALTPFGARHASPSEFQPDLRLCCVSVCEKECVCVCVHVLS